MRIFLAGASGAIGQRLAPLLRNAGYHVTGTTRSAAKLDPLREIGVEPVIVDVFDATALTHAVVTARPDIVIHQLTDLPPALAPDLMVDALVRNARIRDEGTRNLVQAALAAGARRMVAQSIAWTYAPGRTPHIESDPLKVEADGSYSVSIGGVVALEKFTLHSPPLEGVVLRYGQLHGPGTGADAARGPVPLHVDAAAYAALLAIDRGAPGIYNVTEPNEMVSSDKARDQLGWNADFRLRLT
jgi:nucleoside-diphosphate-sugar epimerase